MFNVGGGELLVILLIALLVLGPDRLPEFAKKAGKVMAEVRRVSQGFQSEIRQAMDFNDDKPEPTRPATPSTPRLVEPPPPTAAPPTTGTSVPSDPTPPVSASEPSAPEASEAKRGDEPASGTSAA
jgi:sec-independent protein translocase protein TatB